MTENLNEEDVDVHAVEENVPQAQGVGGLITLWRRQLMIQTMPQIMMIFQMMKRNEFSI